jgi:hypothetical protein
LGLWSVEPYWPAPGSSHCHGAAGAFAHLGAKDKRERGILKADRQSDCGAVPTRKVLGSQWSDTGRSVLEPDAPRFG